MSSNLRRLALLAFSLVVVMQTGCDRFLKSSATAEEKAKKETIDLSPAGMNCLEKLPDQLEKFIEDKASVGDVETAYGCLNKALDTFSRFTAGSEANVYTDEELRHFLNRYLLKKNQVSKDFMSQLMKLKLLMIGGSARSMTRTELKQMENFISIFKEESLKLNGWMRILLFQAGAPDVSTEKLEELNRIVKSVASRLLHETKAAGSLYEFSDLQSLVSEVRGFLGQTRALEPVLKWMPLLSQLKNMFFGTHSKIASEREWQEASAYALDGYSMALEFFYRLRKQDFNTHESWSRVIQFVDRGLDFLDRAPVLNNDGRFETRALDGVLDEIWSLNLLKLNLNVDTVKKSYRMVVLRVLDRNASRQAQAVEVVALDRKHLSVLRQEYNVWRVAQSLIMNLFKDRRISDGVDAATLTGAIESEPVLVNIAGLKQGPEQREALLASWAQWAALLKDSRPVQWTESMKVLMRYDVPTAKTSFAGLNLLNALRSVSRLVLRAYGEGEGADAWQLKIKEQGLLNMQEDFRAFGREVRFLDPRSEDPAIRTFKEANFFTFHGNGDDWLDARELTEELSVLISGGAHMTQDVLALANQAQCQTGKIDIFDQPIYRNDCFEKVLRTNFSSVLENLPGMTTLAKMMTNEQWDSFYKSMLAVAALDQREEGTIEYAEIRTGLVVLQYVETLMVVYDTNRDGRLTEKEILGSAPRFRGFIKSISPLGDFMVDDIFLYLAYKGKKPGAMDLISFKFEKSMGLGDIGRVELMNVLAVLKKDAAKK